MGRVPQACARRRPGRSAPTPQVPPAVGRTGRTVCTALMGLGAVAFLTGVALALCSESGWWALLGATGAVACGAAVAYYRISRSAWSRTWIETGSGPGDPGDAPLDRLVFRAPEAFVATGVAVPCLCGVLSAVLTGEWRWAETGFVVGAVLPVFGGIVTALVVEIRSGPLSFGHLLFAGLLVVGGLPGILLGWLWTSDTRVFLFGGPVVAVAAVVSALASVSASLGGD